MCNKNRVFNNILSGWIPKPAMHLNQLKVLQFCRDAVTVPPVGDTRMFGEMLQWITALQLNCSFFKWLLRRERNEGKEQKVIDNDMCDVHQIWLRSRACPSEYWTDELIKGCTAVRHTITEKKPTVKSHPFTWSQFLPRQEWQTCVVWHDSGALPEKSVYNNPWYLNVSLCVCVYVCVYVGTLASHISDLHNIH